VAETWRIETHDTVHAVEVVRRGACWAVASDGDHAVLHSTPRVAVQAWAYCNSVMGMVLAPGEPTRTEAVAAAREDLARIGRLVECDSLVGVEIHAAVEHVVRHELEAARDAAERAERERDDALAIIETMRAEHAPLREPSACERCGGRRAVQKMSGPIPCPVCVPPVRVPCAYCVEGVSLGTGETCRECDGGVR
jgi:hypothetical protein